MSIARITVSLTLALLTLAAVLVFLPGVYLNGLIQRRIERAIEQAYPSYSIRIGGLEYGIWRSRLRCDSIVVIKNNGTVSCTIGSFSVTEVSRIKLLLGDGDLSGHFAGASGEARSITLTFPKSQYILQCERLSVSVPDSSIVVGALELHPAGSDDKFFAASNFRRTRYRLSIPQCTFTGSAILRLLDGKPLSTRKAQLRDPFLDILINKEKPSADSLPPLMPNEIFSRLMKSLRVARVNITDGRVIYGETFDAGARPALMTVEGLDAQAEGLVNRPNEIDTVVVRAQGKLMGDGRLKLVASIPLTLPAFRIHYTGSVQDMQLTSVNRFLEIAEHKRFKSGSLYRLSFDIQVIAGVAKGEVRAAYKDLKMASIDETGSESGIGNFIASFIANNIRLRTTNLPDESGETKIGEVNYEAKPNDTFFEFVWCALRGGIGDIVGF